MMGNAFIKAERNAGGKYQSFNFNESQIIVAIRKTI